MGSGGRESDMQKHNSGAVKREESKRLSRKARKATDFVKTYEEGGKNLVQGWMKKKANGGLWQKRWFVLHERYLTYLKKEPHSVQDFESGNVGSINLWNVDHVIVEDCEITIQLVPKKEKTEKRGEQLIRMMSNIIQPEAVVLRCDTPDSAQRWRQAMYAAAIEGGAGKAFNSEGSSFARNGLASDQSDTTVVRDNVDIHSLRVVSEAAAAKGKSLKKAQVYFESKRLIGVTRMRIGRIPVDSRVEIQLARSGKDIGTITSDPIESYKLSSGEQTVHKIYLLDTALFKDGVEVVIEQDTMGSIGHMVSENSQAVAGLVALVAIGSAALVPFAGGIAALLTASVTLWLAAGAVFFINKDSAVITGVSVIPMHQARQGLIRAGRSSRSSSKRNVNSARESMRKQAEEAEEAEDDAVEVGDGPDISSKEKQVIAQIREACKDLFEKHKDDEKALFVLHKYLDHDFRMVRFVRARNLNFKKAEKFFRVSMAWRIEFDAENVHSFETVPDWALQYAGSNQLNALLKEGGRGGPDRLPWYFVDKKKRLSLVLRAGKLNQKKVFKKFGSDGETFFRLGVWIFQFMQDDLDRWFEMNNGKVPCQLDIIIDLEGFSLSDQLPIKDGFNLAQKYLPKVLDAYPEVLGRVIVVNAPFLFHGVWKVFQPLFPPRVIEKISIDGSSKSTWTKKILKEFEPDQVPKAYGGTLEIDGDPYCMDRIPCRGPYLEGEGKDLLIF